MSQYPQSGNELADEQVELTRWLIDFDSKHGPSLLQPTKQKQKSKPGSIPEIAPNQLIKHLRQLGCSAQQSSLWMELYDCRKRATRKFSDPTQLFFTRRSYEQSSGQRLAQWKQHWLQQHTNKPTVVVDLCCGMGADAMSFCQTFPVLAVDYDPQMTLMAQQNLQQSGSANPHLAIQLDVNKILANRTNIAADTSQSSEPRSFGQLVSDLCLSLTEARNTETAERLRHWTRENQLADHQVCWHLDPDRRSDAGRHIRLQDFSPDLEFICRLQKQFPLGLLKVAPATEIPDLWQDAVDWVWLGEDRECKQLVGCFHQSVTSGRAAGVWNRAKRDWELFEVAETDQPRVSQISLQKAKPGDLLIQFHSAVSVAGLSDSLAEGLQASQIAGDDFYLKSTSIEPTSISDTELYSEFEVLEILPAKAKAIAGAVRRVGGRLTEVKKRQADTNLQTKLTRELKPCFSLASEVALSVLLVQAGGNGKVQAVLATRRQPEMP